MKLKYFSVFFLLFVLYSCKDKTPENPITTNFSNGVWILNEGNYGWGNSSIDFYDFTKNELIADVFKRVNNRPLGDVFQSMIRFNGQLFLVVNNSSKIEICNSNSLQFQNQITGLNSPRYFLQVNADKVYLSSLYENKITAISLTDNHIIKKIPCKGWSEEMLLSNNKVFVCNMKSDSISVFDADSDTLITGINVGYASGSIRKDKNGMLWVLCNGDLVKGKKSKLCKIDPQTFTIVAEFPLNTYEGRKLRLDASAENLYFLNGLHVYKMNLNDLALPTTPFIDGTGKTLYGLNVNPSNGDVYVSDAGDYVQKGMVYVYESSGTFKFSFQSGIIPGDFYF